MNIFLAGATGVIGRPLVPLLRDAGHAVTGTTRSAEKAAALEALGARGVVVDVYDAARCCKAMAAAQARRGDPPAHRSAATSRDPAQIAAVAREATRGCASRARAT